MSTRGFGFWKNEFRKKHSALSILPILIPIHCKGCAVKNWTTSEGFISMTMWSSLKTNWYLHTVLSWEKVLLFTIQSKSIVGGMSHFSHEARNAFCNSPISMSLTSKWTLFFSWSMFDASQLPVYTACFRLSIKRSTGRSWGTFDGFEVFGPSRTWCSWKSSKHSLPLFQGQRSHGCMDLFSLVECYAIFPEGLSVADSWNTTYSWILNQASSSWPPSGDLTRHLQACAGGVGQVVPDSAFFYVVFLSSNDWRTWENSGFCKTSVFKKRTNERFSLFSLL